jgi:hypothetical protein
MEDQAKVQAVWTLQTSEAVAEKVAEVLGIRVEPAAITRRHNRMTAAKERKEERLKIMQELDEAKDSEDKEENAAVEVVNAPGGDDAPGGGGGVISNFEDGLAQIPIIQSQGDGDDDGRLPGGNLTGQIHLLSAEQFAGPENMHLAVAGGPPPPPPPGGSYTVPLIDLRDLNPEQVIFDLYIYLKSLGTESNKLN